MKCLPCSFAQMSFQQEDDIDKLFKKLEPIEPPGEVIARILSHVKQLSRPTEPQQPEQLSPQKEATAGNKPAQDRLIVHNEHQAPS